MKLTQSIQAAITEDQMVGAVAEQRIERFDAELAAHDAQTASEIQQMDKRVAKLQATLEAARKLLD